jgi:hypothetical protein
MKIRVLGGGVYGCHIALALINGGHTVELHEIKNHLFAGASGGIPARLHCGPHYPRSYLTRAACRDHYAEFMSRYGHLTRGVPINIYAISAHDSLVDFGTFTQVLKGEVEFVTIHDPAEHGLQNVEGAILTGERHIVTDLMRDYFTTALDGHIVFNSAPGNVDDPNWDMNIDCTFCANDAENIDRFEPCVTVLLEGPVTKAVTIMDGPFGSIYPWNEDRNLCSLTSAKCTPVDKSCRTWMEARRILDEQNENLLKDRAELMMVQMEFYWPAVRDLFKVRDFKLTIRAMPRSAADSRLVDVVRIGERALRVRAGKIDAVFHAERIIKEQIAASRNFVKAKMVA